MVITRRQGRLRCRRDARLQQQYPQHTLGARLGALVGERRRRSRSGTPRRGLHQQLHGGHGSRAQRRVEHCHRECSRERRRCSRQNALQRGDAELRCGALAGPVHAGVTTSLEHSDRDAHLDVQLIGVGPRRHPQPVVPERRHPRQPAADRRGTEDVERSIPHGVHAAPHATDRSPFRGACESALTRGRGPQLSQRRDAAVTAQEEV